jgi:Asp/Glu/hydantoin racemase
MKRILVINPNSSEETTRAMAEGVAFLARPGSVAVDCVTLPEGPPGIETQRHVEQVVLPLADRIAAERADAYVIGCYSDPGLHLARETVPDRPVLGIAESAYLAAIGLGQRFGVVAILDRSIPRHLRHLRQLGLIDRLAGDRALGIGVAGLSGAGVVDRIAEVGRRLIDTDGADVLILGCAGMGRHRPAIEDRLGVPVVDPAQAAVARALSLLDLGYRRTV